jgi:protein-tyrosine phosphatase
VLFVCLGNICRSPLAEGILKREAVARGLSVTIDSAGTGDWHAGQLPDPRACSEGTARGCDMTMRARQVKRDDFERFDLIVAMDAANLRDLRRMAGKNAHKVRMLRSFDPLSHEGAEVPDPYYGQASHFTEVGDMIDRAVDGILRELGH